MTKEFGDFRDLDAWKKSRAIRVKIRDLCAALPPEEKYSLVSQMVRASRSATACIAEGYGRYHYQENIQFCRQARGSLFELVDHLLVAHECQYISVGKQDEIIDEIKVAIKILNGYIRYLQKRKENRE